MTVITRKLTLPLFALGVLLLSAGCADHNDPSAVAPAPGVTPPATVTPPPPMTLKPGMMDRRRGATLPPPVSH